MALKSQYSGSCKACGSSWNQGDDVHYKKDPKCICSNKTCFDQQVTAGGLDMLLAQIKLGQVKPAESQKPESKPTVQQKTDRTIEQRTKDCTEMMTLILPIAFKHAREIDEIKNITDPTTKAHQTLIVAQCFFKGLVEDWTR